MPNERLDVETDGDPKTLLEDTAVHERTGFLTTAKENAEESGGKNAINAPVVRRDEM